MESFQESHTFRLYVLWSGRDSGFCGKVNASSSLTVSEFSRFPATISSMRSPWAA
jgi:hypothetical protein